MPVYLLIDDDAGDAADAGIYAAALGRQAEGLMITPLKPSVLAKTLEDIVAARPDGLLLDVDLTNALGPNREVLGFDGIALAQQIRTLQTRGRVTGEGLIPEIPLVRFSKGDVIREYVSDDSTSNDLFDEKIEKGHVADHAPETAQRLVALAADYPGAVKLSASQITDHDLAEALGCDVAFLERLEPRTVLGLRRPEAPAHILARFFTARFLKRPGPVYDEALLAVRLGVDISASRDWAQLRDLLTDVSGYKGLFATGYPRWWHQKVLDWWGADIEPDTPPYRLTAPERVEVLGKGLGLKSLVALSENRDSPGLKFWHRCRVSGLPVDPARGYALLPTYDQETWQDTAYLCEEEALRDRTNVRLGPSERSRLGAILAARNVR